MTLEYWFCWSGIYQEKQRKILDAFEKEATNIKINDVTVPANIRDKMLTAVAAWTRHERVAWAGRPAAPVRVMMSVSEVKEAINGGRLP